MMECNKEEAIRAKEIAEKKMEGRDFVGALKIASKAQKLYPVLDNIEQMILVCNVLCAAENKICESESDWYDILKVDPTATGAIIKKQYRKFALLLHPDKNKFPGAADAFKMIGEAQKVLLDYEKRTIYDNKRVALGKSQVPLYQVNKQSKAQSSSTEKQTFWTACPSCSTKYQYYKEIKNKTLWCQRCNMPFTGCEINTPNVATGTNSNQPKQYHASTQCHVRINPKTVPVNLVPKTTVHGKSVNLEAKGRSGGNKMKGKTDNKVSAESKNEENSRRPTWSRQHVSYSEHLKDEDELANSSKRPKISPSKVENSEETETFEYPGPDLSDFDKDRAEKCLKVGQIWAFYDVLDAMPRFYAVINMIFSPGFKLQITWLEPDPDDEDERKWVLKGLPASCGKFKLGNSEIIKDPPMLSHMMFWEKGKNQNTYKIYPKKGETWALFIDWDMKWHSQIEINTKYEYEFVEVLSDYTDGIDSVYVTPLVKVKGYMCLFHRKEGESIKIPKKELFKFSHRIPCCKMTGTERKDVPKGSFELDPASLPIVSKDKNFPLP